MIKKNKNASPARGKVRYRFTRKNISLITRRQHLPNGRDIDLDMIDHPGAVCIVPVLNKEQFILLRQYRPAVQSYLYEFPAGTLDAKEAPLTCARRELKEETGYVARRWSKQGKIFPLPAYSNEQILIYKAEGLTLGQSDREEYEVIDVHAVKRSQIRKLFLSGKIIDAKTICALSFCRIL